MGGWDGQENYGRLEWGIGREKRKDRVWSAQKGGCFQS